MEGEQGRKHVVLFLSSVCSILELQCAICVLLKTLSGLVLGLFRLCLGFVCSWFGIHIWRAVFFFPRQVLFFFWFLVLCFPVSLIFCFSASLLLCFFAFLLFCLYCFSAFPASLLFCFLRSLLLCFSCFSAFLLFAFPTSLLFCFSVFPASCTSVPFYFYYSTFLFLQSCVFAALLPAPLLLCFLSLLSLCFSFSFALFCSVCILNETLERP